MEWVVIALGRPAAFLAVTAVLALSLWFWFPKAGGGADPGFVLLSVREVNNRGVLAGTVATGGGPVATFDPEKRLLLLGDPAAFPPRGARIVVLHRADSLDLNLHTGLHASRRFPFELAVNRPFHRPGRVIRDGRVGERRNVVDNRTRLTGYPLIVESADVEGGVNIRLGPHRAYIAPHQAWGVAWVYGRQGRVEVRDGPDWEERLRGELRQGSTVTVFSVENHGRLSPGEVRL